MAEITANGGESIAVLADVSDRSQLEIARDKIIQGWGQIDILVNSAGGNIPAATITPDATIFDMPHTAFEEVISLNLVGTLLPSQVFGQAMVEKTAPRLYCQYFFYVCYPSH